MLLYWEYPQYLHLVTVLGANIVYIVVSLVTGGNTIFPFEDIMS